MVESALGGQAGLRPSWFSRLSLGRLAFGVTLATVLVVLFGAVVRITGSGAGCGQHWPTCHGEVAHLPRSVETWIELTHRTTSGLDFLAVLGLVVVAWLRLPSRHPSRIAALLAFGLMLVEVAIGARLVLLNLVGSNMSFDRAVVMPAHLVTTSLLIGTLAAATYFVSEARLTPDRATTARQRTALRAAFWWVAGAAGLLLLVSMTGAVTALGDTVYPVRGSTTLEHVQNDQAAGAHFLGKVRVVHPLLALLGVAGLWVAGGRARSAAASVPAASLIERLGAGMYWGGGLALAIGLLNVMLAAPGYLQVVHLAMACLLWLGTVVLACALWDAQRTEASSR